MYTNACIYNIKKVSRNMNIYNTSSMMLVYLQNIYKFLILDLLYLIYLKCWMIYSKNIKAQFFYELQQIKAEHSGFDTIKSCVWETKPLEKCIISLCKKSKK